MGAIQQALAGYGSAAASYNAETIAWENGIIAAGGSVTTTEKNWADALIVAIQGATYGSKIKLLYPLLTSSIVGARMPLRDTFSKGIANSYGSSAFTNSDVGNAVGVTNPTEKNAYLGTGLLTNWNTPTGACGLGFYERNIGLGANVEPMGSSGASTRYCLDLRSSFQRFRWGGVTATQAGPATTATNGHYYGQYNGSITEIYKDGSSLGTNGVGDVSSTGSVDEIFFMGSNSSPDTPWKGRCAVAYVTDGSMSSADISAFHTLLGTYLITPTGR